MLFLFCYESTAGSSRREAIPRCPPSSVASERYCKMPSAPHFNILTPTRGSHRVERLHSWRAKRKQEGLAGLENILFGEMGMYIQV